MPPPKPSLTLEEWTLIKELKDDHYQVVLKADKAISLLADSNTYSMITKDPTTRLKK